jgi:nucleoside-diphosphate-sugar epimerase
VSRILVTGGTGFIGRALCPILLRHGLRVSVATRSPRVAETIGGVDVRPIPGIGPRVDWSVVLRDVDAIVHLAAKVPTALANRNPQHDRDDQRVNVGGARKLGEDAAAAGIRRIVYVSTASVHGARTAPDQAFSEADPPAPADPHAYSKCEGERALAEVAKATGLELVVLRPPLVYGPEVKGDFLALLHRVGTARAIYVARPSADHPNRRSLLSVENLCDAIVRCLATAEAAGHTFLVRDGEDLSMPEIIRTLAQAMMRDLRIVQVPKPLLRVAARLTGNSTVLDRLSTPFCIDDSAIRQQLGWTPHHSVVEGLAATAAWYASSSR